jgi:hypothetical protein
VRRSISVQQGEEREEKEGRTGENDSEVVGIRSLRDEVVDGILDAEAVVKLATDDVEGAVGVVGEFIQFGGGLFVRLLTPLSHVGGDSPVPTRHSQRKRVEGKEGVNAPVLQRVMLEDLENGHDDAGTLTKDSQRLLAASTEDPIDTAHSEAINEIVGEAEGDEFGNGKSTSLRGKTKKEGKVSGERKQGKR